MISFVFSYNTEEIATINDLSKFSNKTIWKLFEETVTQQTKSMLINELSDIRDKLEKEQVIINCNFNIEKQDFEFSFEATDELNQLILDRLK